LERERRIANRLLLGEPEGKKQLGRPRHKWVVNSKQDLEI
jgi:hypothetical protein